MSTEWQRGRGAEAQSKQKWRMGRKRDHLIPSPLEVKDAPQA